MKLATHPTDEPDLLALIADPHTITRKPFADRFREACRAEALDQNGWVNPNRVRARLLADGGIDNPRQLSALWSTACARGGYLTKTEHHVPIEGEGSRGNGGKSVPLRRWIGDL